MVNGRDVDGKGGNGAMIERNIRTMDMSEPWIGVEMEEGATIIFHVPLVAQLIVRTSLMFQQEERSTNSCEGK